MLCREGFVDRVFQVVTGRCGPQLNGGFILFGVCLQFFNALGGLARDKDKDTRCKRVQRTSMSSLHAFHAQLLREQIAYMGQGTKAGYLVRFVDGDDFSRIEVHHIQRLRIYEKMMVSTPAMAQ